MNFEIRIPLLISKDLNENIICHMDVVRGDVLGPPHGTTPATVIANKIILRSFKNIEHIKENKNGPYRRVLHFFIPFYNVYNLMFYSNISSNRIHLNGRSELFFISVNFSRNKP